MPKKGLHEATRKHYERAIWFLAERIAAKCLDNPDREINILDVGCGEKSILISAVEQICEELRGKSSDDRPKSLEKICRELKNARWQPGNLKLWFLDKTEFDEIFGELNSIYLPRKKNEFECCGFKFDAKFVRADFGEMILNENYAQTEFSGCRFDSIVFHFVNHEIFDRAKINGDEYVSGKDYVEKLFAKFGDMTIKNGFVLLGDVYYPLYLTAEESYETIKNLRVMFGRGDAPAVYSYPERILETALKKYPQTFEILEDDSMLVCFYAGKKRHCQKTYLTVLRRK